MISLFSLSACFKVGPDYHDPKLNIANKFPGVSKKKNASVKDGHAKIANWWKVFSDPTLDKLIQTGYHHNLTLYSAGVRVLMARAQLAQTVGELYPQQQVAQGSYTYNRIGGSSLEQILPSTFNTASLGFGANWEIDFWGSAVTSDVFFLTVTDFLRHGKKKIGTVP